MKKISLKSGAMAAVLAGTMALSMVPATAFADEAKTPENYNTTQTIVKTYEYGKTPLVAQTFTFDLAYANKAEKVGSNETQVPTKVEGKEGKVTVTTPATDDSPADEMVSATAKLKDLVDQYNFSAPGKYYFTLSEESSNNPNISDSQATYTVRVDVVWNAHYSATTINGVALFKNTNGVAGDKKEASADFTNGSKAATGAFKVSKKVSGTAANTNDYFKYTLQLIDTTQVAGSYTVVDKDGKTVATLSKGNDYTVDFYLKDGGSVSVTGLPKGTDYKVTESEKVVEDNNGTKTEGTDDNGYTETYKVNNGESEKGTVATGTVQDADTTVAYTNDKGFATSTGVTMNMLPGIGIAVVAVAGGATLVISRRKRAGQDF